MPTKKKNNQPAKVSLRKRLLVMFTYVEIFISEMLLKVQRLMKTGKKEQRKVFKKNLTTKKKKKVNERRLHKKKYFYNSVWL
jgi:hypothetical protein